MNPNIRLGIVGTGGMANWHAKTFQSIAGVTLTSCLDVVPGRAEEFAAKYQVAHVARRLEELFEQVDAVVVVTPDRFHREPSLAALAAGKHLLCEKPLCPTLAEAREVAQAAAAAAKRGVIHMVNFSYRASAAFQRAIELTRAGRLGALRHVHSYYLQSWLASGMGGSWTKESMLWRLQTGAGSGGVLGDLGCHILDMTTAVGGDVARLRCDLRTYPKVTPDGRTVTEWEGRPLDANDTAIIEVEFTHGAVGIVHTTRWATGYKNSLHLEVHGTEGALRFDLDRHYHAIELCLGEARQTATWTTESLPPAPDNQRRFIAAIRSGQPEQPDILRGAQVQAYLDACERSARSGNWEPIRAWQ